MWGQYKSIGQFEIKAKVNVMSLLSRSSLGH